MADVYRRSDKSRGRANGRGYGKYWESIDPLCVEVDGENMKMEIECFDHEDLGVLHVQFKAIADTGDGQRRKVATLHCKPEGIRELIDALEAIDQAL